jgi:hypothetical protein
VTTEGKGRRASENGERFSVLFSLFLFFFFTKISVRTAQHFPSQDYLVCVYTL